MHGDQYLTTRSLPLVDTDPPRLCDISVMLCDRWCSKVAGEPYGQLNYGRVTALRYKQSRVQVNRLSYRQRSKSMLACGVALTRQLAFVRKPLPSTLFRRQKSTVSAAVRRDQYCFVAPGEPATQSLASILALDLRAGDCYCLLGDVGAGKSVFRQVWQGIAGSVSVQNASPHRASVARAAVPLSEKLSRMMSCQCLRQHTYFKSFTRSMRVRFTSHAM